MKKIILVFLICFSSYAQEYKITYSKSTNGKKIDNQDEIIVITDINNTRISLKSIEDKKAKFPYEETSINRNDGTTIIQTAYLNDNKTIFCYDSISLKKQIFEFLPETKKILTYNCKKAKTVINSNNIELWYTNEIKVKGSPSVLGLDLGLVLEYNRNGNFIITASKIEKIKTKNKAPKNISKKKLVDNLTYKDLLWKSRFTTISVFKDEIINFSDVLISNDSVMKFANGTIAVRKIKLPEIKPSSQIFIDLLEQSNGDAYDRTGSVFIIPTEKEKSFLNGLQNTVKDLPVYDNGNGKKYQGVVATENYAPIIELMRFFTPFGIKQYNYIELKDKKWQDAVTYRQDISDLRVSLSNKEIYIGTFIGNYDKGGHKISMNITIHTEEETQLNKENFVLPLFNSVNVMEMAGQEYATMFDSEKGLVVNFNLDKDIKNAKLRFITTGHGGWENGDEFVPKLNTILIDGKEIYSFIPWRQDCGSYRLYNPASGNFPNGLSSSDYSRSNWCPGMSTNPEYITLGNLSAGKHSITIKIPQGIPEGTSFSAWNVSGVLLGE